MKPGKTPKKTIAVKAKPTQAIKYKIYSQGESSFGYWIIPMTVLIVLGLLYIALVVFLNTSTLNSDSKSNQFPSIKIDNPLSNSNLFENRQRAGVEVNLNLTSWGKEDPITPPKEE